MTPETAFAEAMKFENRAHTSPFSDPPRTTTTNPQPNGLCDRPQLTDLHQINPNDPHNTI